MTFDAVAQGLRADERFTAGDPGKTDETLRSLRTAFDASPDAYDRREALSARIGSASEPWLRCTLVDVRHEFDRQAIAVLIDHVQQAFARSGAEGWTAWLRAVGEAIARFRHNYAGALCEHSFAFDGAHESIVRDMRGAAARLRQSRWDEVDDAVAFLAAQQEVMPPATRAQLLVVQAQIELSRFLEPKRATALLAEAERLAPEDVQVLATLGDLHAQQGHDEQAIRYYQRAIEVGPTASNGYVGMGEQLEKDERSGEAETWFRRAVTQAAGEASGYDGLLRLFVRTGVYRTDTTECLDLLERRIAVDPEGEYDVYLALGDHCRDYCHERPVSDENRRWYQDQARSWYERARSLHPDWPLVYEALGELCKDEGDVSKAESAGQQAIAVAPEWPSGYLFLGPFYESHGRQADAADIYERFPSRPYRWKLYATASLGRLQAELGDYAQAQRTLLDVLRQEAAMDREQVFAEVALENLAEDSYRKRGDATTARQIFDAILTISGERYRARYHHLLGNLWYYGSDYVLAIEHYRQAISAAPKEAWYHRFLSEAFRALSNFSEAQVEIERAFALDGDDKRRREESASLANSQGNHAFERGEYREAIPHYTRAVELEPSTAVYQANLALAWEYLKESGHRLEHLDNALRCYGRAQEIAGAQRYEDRIQRLRQRIDLARGYGEQALDWLALVTPIAVEVAEDLVRLVADSTASKLSVDLEHEVEATRRALTSELGLTVPGIRFRGNEGGLPSGTYIVFINEVPLVSGVALPGRRYFAGTAQELAERSVSGEPASDPMNPGAWVAQKDWETVTADDGRLWTVTRYLMRHLEAVIRRNAAEFVGHQEVVNLLKAASGSVPEAILALSTTLSGLTNVCRALAAEGVSIGPFDELCTTFKGLYDDSIRPREIAERVRLLPGIRESLPGRNARSYLRAGEGFEAEIRRSLYRKSDRIVLAMTPERCQAALQAVRDRVGAADDHTLALIVADPAVRPFVRKLVELEFPNLPVLSAAEARDGVESLSTRVDFDLPQVLTTIGFQSAVTVGRALQEDETTQGAPTQEERTSVVEVTVAAGVLARRSVADEGPHEVLLSLMRDGLFQELGMFVPHIDFREDGALPEDSFEVRINGGEPVRLTGLQHDEILVSDRPDRLRLLNLHGRAAANPATGGACTIIRVLGDEVGTCQRAGLTLWGRGGYLVLHVSALLRRAAVTLQTEDTTRYLLDSLALAHPDLVQSATQRYPVAGITRVLRHLLADEISVRNLRSILESLLCVDGSSDVDLDRFIVFSSNAEPLCFDPQGRAVAELPASVLADQVRTCLKPYISHKYAGGSSTLTVYLLHADIEQRLRTVPAQPLTADESSRLIAAVRKELPLQTGDVRPVLLTNLDVRATARAALREAFPMLSVLSYQELSPELNISPVARIAWR